MPRRDDNTAHLQSSIPFRRRYPSDLTDRQWKRVRGLLLSDPPRTGRPRETQLREVLCGCAYRWATGCSWRMLPHDLPHWSTVYGYHRDWEQSGLIEQLRMLLRRRR